MKMMMRRMTMGLVAVAGLVMTGCGGIEEQMSTEERQAAPVAPANSEAGVCSCGQFTVDLSELTAQHSGCDSASMTSIHGYNTACIAAANRYCTTKGYEAGTIVEAALPSVGLSCLDAVDFVVGVSTLTAQDSQCTSSTMANASGEYSRVCNQAANRFCKSKGYVSGLLQETLYNTNLEVSCINKPLGTGYKSAVPFSTWSAYHGDCAVTYSSAANSKACRAAANRYCKNVHGMISGIIVEWGSTNDLVCLN